jgi:hypothetical protein
MGGLGRRRAIIFLFYLVYLGVSQGIFNPSLATESVSGFLLMNYQIDI